MGYRGKEKHPKVSKIPHPLKQPKAEPVTNFHNLNPSWRFSKIALGGRWAWHQLTADQIRYIREKLVNFETMTWGQILVGAKKSNHSVPVDSLVTDAQEHLEIIGYGDLDSVVSLRLSSKERVWGVLTQGALLLLWWDPNHEISPSILKHT